MRTEKSESLEFDTETNAMTALVGTHLDLYFGGDMNASLALSGQVAGRIDEVEPVADILGRTADECQAILTDLASRYA